MQPGSGQSPYHRSRTPLPPSLTQLARRTVGEASLSPAYRATLNLVLPEQSVQQLPAEGRHVAVVELGHRSV
jgi:hypothetical protein